MSRTDKTRPYHVKMSDKLMRHFFTEWHPHERTGVCTIDAWTIELERPCNARSMGGVRFTSCRYIWSAQGRKYFFSTPKSKQVYRRKHYRSERTHARMSAREVLKLSRADQIDYDFETYQHRNSARWDCM